MKYLKLLPLLLISFPFCSFAAGLQISPAKISLDAANSSQVLTISNPTSDVMVFQIYADDFGDEIKINPSSFTLEAGGRKNVNVSLNKNRLRNEQLLATNLSVLSSPLAQNGLQLATGAKIPLTINLSPEANKNKNNSYFLGIALVIIIALGAAWQNRKNK